MNPSLFYNQLHAYLKQDRNAWRINGYRIHDIEIATHQHITRLGLPFMYRFDKARPVAMTLAEAMGTYELDYLHTMYDTTTRNALFCVRGHELQTIETPGVDNLDALDKWDSEEKYILRIYHTKFNYLSWVDEPTTEHLIVDDDYARLTAPILRFVPQTTTLIKRKRGDRYTDEAYRMLPWTGMRLSSTGVAANEGFRDLEAMMRLESIDVLSPETLMALFQKHPGRCKKAIDTMHRIAAQNGLPGRGRPRIERGFEMPWVREPLKY